MDYRSKSMEILETLREHIKSSKELNEDPNLFSVLDNVEAKLRNRQYDGFVKVARYINLEGKQLYLRYAHVKHSTISNRARWSWKNDTSHRTRPLWSSSFCSPGSLSTSCSTPISFLFRLTSRISEKKL